ncbi:hypothetical protein ONZ51_g6392 [Trametes cubensis]|uniref:Uncharacterized protein n=1 Tax=Trametes cubensis TaxID=1111947 RepID=A0AAD7TT87_9APHY|nr:hypothetical protein ONZ51_g6392 [Trametes cubensis]
MPLIKLNKHTRFCVGAVPLLIALVAHHAKASSTSRSTIPRVRDTESTIDILDHSVDVDVIVQPRGPKVIYTSYEEILRWIAENDPSLLATGPLGSEALVGLIPAAPANNPDTTVLFCSTISGETCGQPCTWYTGGPGCVNAPDTNCALATYDVEFCNQPNCEPVCGTTYADCESFLENGFCRVPETNSFLVLSH